MFKNPFNLKKKEEKDMSSEELILSIAKSDICEFYDELSKILVNLPDQRIAEIYCDLNSWKIPPELRGLKPYVNVDWEDSAKDSNENKFMAYWTIFTEITRKIIPNETITKEHYRRLSEKNFEFGNLYLNQLKNKLKNEK